MAFTLSLNFRCLLGLIFLIIGEVGERKKSLYRGTCKAVTDTCTHQHTSEFKDKIKSSIGQVNHIYLRVGKRDLSVTGRGVGGGVLDTTYGRSGRNNTKKSSFS